jgi:DtxR family Mn-dependent transcriptional regulator
MTTADDEKLIRLSDLPLGQPTPVVIRRLAEYIQSEPDVIRHLRDNGIVPDARVTVEVQPGTVTISVGGHDSFELAEDLAHAVSVRTV